MSRLVISTVLLAVLAASSADSDVACDAKKPAAVGCVSWRQTGGCNPSGQREPDGDKKCTDTIAPGASGYCECSNGHRVEKTCDHLPIICSEECAHSEKHTCMMWRQTGDCSADGPREENNDQSCETLIQPGSSGYCECGSGRKIKKTGCRDDTDSDPWTCSDACLEDVSFYELLDIEDMASEKDIKRAFRKISLKYHPDRIGKNLEKKAVYEKIRQAYEVLGNAEQRYMYDMSGASAALPADGKQLQKGQQNRFQMQIELRDLYLGAAITQHVNRKIICKKCATSNAQRCRLCTERCPNEIALVDVRFGNMILKQQREVASKEKCRMVTTPIVVDVEPGMVDGEEIVFPLMGEQRPGQIPGDLVVQIKTKPHNQFKRTRNSDLETFMQISLSEALLGFEKTVTHLDGHVVAVVRSELITSPGQVVEIAGEGMPVREGGDERGSLFLKIEYSMPTQPWTAAQRELLAKAFA